MKKLLLITFMLGLCTSAMSQSIKGRITDKNSKPIPFANAVLLKDTVVVDVAVSDNNGLFNIVANNTDVYKLKISSIGYKAHEQNCKAGDIGTIILEEDVTMLSEAVVKANRPLVTQEQDKTIFNVKTMGKLEGMKATDVLQYAPRVIVNPTGGIMVGNTAATVFVNNRQLSGDEATNYLENLDAKDIERIEIQNTHGGDKDASIQGGVINIITKSGITGLSGNVSLYASTPESGFYNYRPNAGFYWGTNNWNIYGSYSYTQARSSQYSETLNDYLHNNTSHFTTTDYIMHTNSHVYKIGSVFTLNKKHSVGIEFNGTSNNPKQSYSTGDILYKKSPAESDNAVANTTYKSNSDYYNLVASYNWNFDTLGSYVRFLGNYNNRNSYSRNMLNTVYSHWTDNNIYETNISDADGKNFSGTADFVKNLPGKWSIRAGGKYLTSKRDSRLNTFEGQNTTPFSSSEWDYTEQIAGGYIGLSKNFTDNIFASASIRAENTDIEGKSSDSEDEKLEKNYTNWFPYFYFSHKLSDNWSYNLVYTKSIYRPAFSLMNAYSNRFSDVLYDIGNPDLKAELTDMLNLTFNFKKHSSSLYYKHTPNVITEYFYVEDDITYHTNINYGKTSSVTLDYNYNDKPVEWWQVNFYIAGFYTHIPKSYNKTEKWSVNASWTNRFFINHIGELMFNINGYTSTIRGNAYQKGTYTTNISYSRSFFKNKLNFRIGINDIFNTMKVRVNNHVPTLNYVFYAKNLTQQFWCSITYNFSTKNKVNKSSVKNDNPILNRL